MVVEYSNKNMNYEKPFVNGVVATPPKIQRENYYNSQWGQQLFNDIHHDVYTRVEAAPPPKYGEFPTILKYALGVTGLTSVILFRKNIWKYLKSFIKSFSK